MALSDTVRHQSDTILTAYCEQRVPPGMRSMVRMHHEFRGDAVTLFEDRPHWKRPEEWVHRPIAQFRFSADNGWTLYCRDQYAHWHLYDIVNPSRSLESLLAEVDKDVTGIFYG